MIGQLLDLSARPEWDPQVLLSPDPEQLWGGPAGPFVNVARALPVLPLGDALVVSPGMVDQTTGAVRGDAARPVRLGYVVGQRNGLQSGDLLVHRSVPAVLIGSEHRSWAFSSMFLAVRPYEGVDPLWLWAALNTPAGARAREAASSRSSTTAFRLRMQDLTVPAEPEDWSVVRRLVADLHAEIVGVDLGTDVGQSWWRIRQLPDRGGAWHRALVFDETAGLNGPPLRELMAELTMGRARREEVEQDPLPGYLPVVGPRQIRGRSFDAWVSVQGQVVADSGDVVIASHTVGKEVAAALVAERVVVGADVFRLRLRPNVSVERVVAWLNSPAGFRQRQALATGSVLPRLRREDLLDLRVGSLDADPPPAPRPLAERLVEVLGRWQ